MVERKIYQKIINALSNFRIVNLTGIRQCGKTTLVRKISADKNIKYVSLDNTENLNFAQNQPRDFLEYYGYPLIIDEVQFAPQLIPYLKIKVDEVNNNGMYLLTGSSNYFLNKNIKESLAGRMVSYELFNFSATELNNIEQNILDVLFDCNPLIMRDLYLNDDKQNILIIANKILTGSFPAVQNVPDDVRYIWFKNYIEARILKDIGSFFDLKKQDKILDLLTVLALQNAGILNVNNLAGKLQIDNKTVDKYLFFLEQMFLIRRLPAFYKNIAKRVTKQKKIHFTDTGLASALLNLTPENLLENYSNLYGQLLENQIFTELLKEASFSTMFYNFYHYRDVRQSEIDIIIENQHKHVIAVEVKLKSEVNRNDVKNILRFAENFKGQFLCGYVFYTGKFIVPISEQNNFKIYAIPVSIFL